MKQIIVIIGILLFISPVYAADSTPSADIKSKLEELKKEIASKAAKLKQEVNRKLKDKAYVGKIKSKSATSVTLSAKSGPKIVSINQDTVFINQIKPKIKISYKNLEGEDYIAALGDADETGVLTAKTIVLMSTPDEQKNFLWGQIISVSDKLATLRDKNFKNVAVSLDLSNIKLNNFVILTGNDKNEIFKAEFVYVIPQAGIIKPARPAGGPKKIATPSATR